MEHGLKEIEWRLTYYTSDVTENGKPIDILHDFYLPALNLATRYDRVAGYFRSSSLAAASQGYTAFLRHGGKMRLIVGADLQVQDVAAVLAGNQQRLTDTLMEELRNPESWPDEVQSGVALLAQMVASGQLEMRVAFRKNSVTGQALAVDSTEDGYVHEKWLVILPAKVPQHPQIIYCICQGVRISARHIQQSVVTMHLKTSHFLRGATKVSMRF